MAAVAEQPRQRVEGVATTARIAADPDVLCNSVFVAVTPDDIIEEIIDGLAMGELGESVEAFEFSRTGPGTLLLDYGDLGRFRLSVVPDNS